MKKRVDILISLLMISWAFTVTSKSYAESRLGQVVGTGIVCTGAGFLVSTIGVSSFLLLNKAKKLLAANRSAKIGRVVLAKKDRDPVLLFLGGTSAAGLICTFLSLPSYASEIVENPALAMEDENFRFLAEVVGTELAFSSVKRIANGEDPETVVNSLASSLEQNFNAEDGFLDSGNEEDIE